MARRCLRESPSPATVKVAQAKAHLSKLLARVERGEEFVIARGDRPIARLAPLDEATRGRAAIDAMLALRESGKIKPVTQAEIRAWIREGRPTRLHKQVRRSRSSRDWAGKATSM